MFGERDAEIHETGAGVVREQRGIRPEFVEGFHVVAPLAPGLPLATGTWVYVDEHHFEIGEERVRAVEFCERLLSLLDRLVSEVPKS